MNRKNTRYWLSLAMAILLSMVMLLSTAVAEVTEAAEVDFENPIPEGYLRIEGEDGVIQDSKGNQFVWVPVKELPANGTLDGKTFSEQFGRRNYCADEFSESRFHEDMDGELRRQAESVERYGGFYVSRYLVSRGEDGLLYSVKGMEPLTRINFHDALENAKKLGQSPYTTHLLYGAEVDTILECEKDLVELVDGVWEWTQEKNGRLERVFRWGQSYCGSEYPIEFRGHNTTEKSGINVGLRVALYIP